MPFWRGSSRYMVPKALWSDGIRLDDYLRRRVEAVGATTDPVEAFVPIADPAQLEEAWNRQAPRPVAELEEAWISGLRRELDALRKANEAMLQSRSWRLTAPLRAIAQSVRGIRIKK
jgi:hypothetical protein